jgi:hypothetical protein
MIFPSLLCCPAPFVFALTIQFEKNFLERGDGVLLASRSGLVRRASAVSDNRAAWKNHVMRGISTPVGGRRIMDRRNDDPSGPAGTLSGAGPRKGGDAHS